MYVHVGKLKRRWEGPPLALPPPSPAFILPLMLSWVAPHKRKGYSRSEKPTPIKKEAKEMKMKNMDYRLGSSSSTFI
jgi:hypothetical protein